MKNKIEQILFTNADTVLSNVDLSKLKGKSVLVTGASGLLGINIVSCLKKIKKDLDINLFCWMRNPVDDNFSVIFDDCNLIIGDISDNSMFKTSMKFDCIIHAAGYGQPLKFLENEITTIKLNTLSTFYLFDILEDNGMFLFVSSTEVYNGLDVINVEETQIGVSNTSDSRACYVEGKRTGEAISNCYARKGYNVKIARLGHTYGPGAKKQDKRVLNSLIEKGLNEDVISLMDSGEARRVFCYITDAVEMLFNILLHGKDITYNVSGNEEISIINLASLISRKLNKSIFVPPIKNSLSGSPKLVNVSNHKYLQEFKKQKFIDISEGLDSTIEWQRGLN